MASNQARSSNKTGRLASTGSMLRNNLHLVEARYNPYRPRGSSRGRSIPKASVLQPSRRFGFRQVRNAPAHRWLTDSYARAGDFFAMGEKIEQVRGRAVEQVKGTEDRVNLPSSWPSHRRPAISRLHSSCYTSENSGRNARDRSRRSKFPRNIEWLKMAQRNARLRRVAPSRRS